MVHARASWNGMMGSISTPRVRGGEEERLPRSVLKGEYRIAILLTTI